MSDEADHRDASHLNCERCGSDEMRILLHHEEAQTVVCAKCGDIVAYANSLTRVSLKAAQRGVKAKGK